MDMRQLELHQKTKTRSVRSEHDQTVRRKRAGTRLDDGQHNLNAGAHLCVDQVHDRHEHDREGGGQLERPLRYLDEVVRVGRGCVEEEMCSSCMPSITWAHVIT